MGMNGHKRYAIRSNTENQGGLIGGKQISQYAGLCLSAVTKYRRLHGFPVCHLPDNRLYTTKSLIDQWIIARQLEQESLAVQADPGPDETTAVDHDSPL